MPFVAHPLCIPISGTGGDFAKPRAVQRCASTSYPNEPLLGIEPNPLLRIKPNKISSESLHVLKPVRHARRNIKNIARL